MASAVRPANRNWLLLIGALAIAGAAALSIHVVMIEVLGVAYPEDGAAPAWARFLNMAGTVVALLVAYRLARPALARHGPVVRTLVVFAVLAMIKETLRGLVMNGVVASAWRFSVLTNIPSIVVMLAIAIAVVALSPRLKGWVGEVVGGCAIAAVVYFGVQQGFGALYGPWLQSMAWLNHDDLYQMPYPIQVMIPAYLTFAEPVAGCAILAALTWDRLSSRPWLRLVQFVALVAFIKGIVFRLLIFGAFIKAPLGQGMLSESQFTFEFLALGLFTGLIWQAWERTAHRRA